MGMHTGSNLTKVKKNNLSAILGTIYQQGPITRNEVAKRLGVTIPTVTTTVKLLIEERLLKETEILEPEVLLGRKASGIDFNKNARYVIGIEWGPYGVTTCIANLRGELLHKKQETRAVDLAITGAEYSGESFLENTIDMVRELVEESGLDRSYIIGAGFATPGIVDSENGLLIRSSMNKVQWNHIPIREKLEAGLGFPVCVENHVRARAVGYELFSSSEHPDFYLYYFARAGVSCCIMEDGELFGKHGAGTGDIGHTTMDVNGPLCVCGKKGCLQAFVGILALSETAKMHIQKYPHSMLAQILADKEKPMADEIAQAIDAGDSELTKALYPAVQYMGISISNIVNLLNVSHVVVDCAVLNSQKLRSQLDGIISDYQMFPEHTEIQTEYVDANRYTGALGASAVMVKEFLTGRFF